jgi:hypothetical protein
MFFPHALPKSDLSLRGKKWCQLFTEKLLIIFQIKKGTEGKEIRKSKYFSIVMKFIIQQKWRSELSWKYKVELLMKVNFFSRIEIKWCFYGGSFIVLNKFIWQMVSSIWMKEHNFCFSWTLKLPDSHIISLWEILGLWGKQANNMKSTQQCPWNKMVCSIMELSVCITVY